MKKLVLSTALILISFSSTACFNYEDKEKGHNYEHYPREVISEPINLNENSPEWLIDKSIKIKTLQKKLDQTEQLKKYNIDIVNINYLHGYSGIIENKDLNCNTQIECLKTAITDFEKEKEVLHIYIFNTQTGKFHIDIISKNSYDTYYLYQDKVSKLVF